MIKPETQTLLQQAVNSELTNCFSYGKHYNSSNEFYGVFLEEYEELIDELKMLKMGKKHLWKNIKTNADYKKDLFFLRSAMKHLLAEASQVAAVIEKELSNE